MEFLKSIRDVAATRKFWVTVVGIAGLVLQDTVGVDHVAYQVLVAVATLYGVWRVPNRK